MLAILPKQVEGEATPSIYKDRSSPNAALFIQHCFENTQLFIWCPILYAK